MILIKIYGLFKSVEPKFMKDFYSDLYKNSNEFQIGFVDEIEIYALPWEILKGNQKPFIELHLPYVNNNLKREKDIETLYKILREHAKSLDAKTKVWIYRPEDLDSKELKSYK